jgi:ribonuclease HI
LNQISIHRVKGWLSRIWRSSLTQNTILKNYRKTTNFTIISQLYHLYQNNIFINNIHLNQLASHKQTNQLNNIYNFITSPNNATTLSLKNNKILFLEQLLTADNLNILPWKNIYLRTFKSPRGPTPGWFRLLLKQNSNFPILHTWPNLQLQPINPFLNTLNLITPQFDGLKNTWTLYTSSPDWHIGKITNTSDSQILFQKYQIINSMSNTIHISPTTTMLQIDYKQTINLKCKTQKRIQYFELNINNQEIQALQNIHADLYKPAPQLLPSLLLSSPEIILIQNIIPNLTYQNQLINLHQKILLLNSTNLHFYTDASILNSQTHDISTSIAWILENDTQIKFNASITHASNSTRAELAALIPLFLIIPTNSQIHIHLDSLSTIQTLTNSIPYNHNSQTKQNNWDIIHILNYLTKLKNINYTTHKVKSHSNNTLHNIADALAKQGACKTELKINLDYLYLPTFFT